MTKKSPWRAALALCALSALGGAQDVQGRDCASIQRRIDALPRRGGVVSLGAGTWICHAPIVISRNNVALRGVGLTTRLTLADHANSPVIVIGSDAPVPEVTVRGVSVSSLFIDGNRAAQDFECLRGVCSASNPLRNNGVTIRKASDVKVENVTVARAASGGLVSELGTVRLLVKDFTAFDNAFDGLAAYMTEASVFTGLHLHDNLAAGISLDIQFRNNVISNAVLDANAKVGIFMRDSILNVFSGLVVRGSGEHGLFLAQVDSDSRLPAAANIFTGVAISNSKGAGIRINDPSCVNNVLSAAVLSGNAACVSEATPGLLKTSAVVCQ